MIGEKGFTLIELMLVILIIGVLISVALPVYSASRDNARLRTCQANLRSLDGALQYFAAENDQFPTLADNPNSQWSMSTSKAGTIVDPDLDMNDLVPTYIKNPPICPSGGDYTYIIAVVGQTAYVKCSIAGHEI